MERPPQPRVFTIPPGAAFLESLARAFADGTLLPDAAIGGDPLDIAGATIYVPTRRAARELRSAFVELSGGSAAILPTIRPLGEFEEDLDLQVSDSSSTLDMRPPIEGLDRLLMLAPLVQAWRRRIPAHIASRFAEEVVVPASASDAIWLARDLAGLMDEIETAGADWTALTKIVPEDLAGWWQVTLDFLGIVTSAWPDILAERQRSNPADFRARRILAEAARLEKSGTSAPVIAAGSTGSIPATARLLSAIARLPNGAVVLPGLDFDLDDESWSRLSRDPKEPSIFGHPQFGLKQLLESMGVGRRDVRQLACAPAELTARNRVLSEALRPAETTDRWASNTAIIESAVAGGCLDGLSLVEAANEREEAHAIALALREAVEEGGRVALVTGDRDLARRVSTEIARYGIAADDSAGTPLAHTAAGRLFLLALRAALVPGDPVGVLSLIKHPLLTLATPRGKVRSASETIELVCLRGGTGRPDASRLAAEFDLRLARIADRSHPPFWLDRLPPPRIDAAREVLGLLCGALAPLAALREATEVTFAELAVAAVRLFEELGRAEDGSVAGLYDGDAGEALASFLRSLVSTDTRLEFDPAEWPDMVDALIATEAVKPSPGADSRVAIWGALEARLQSVDLLVVGGLNEGSWPRRAEPDRFMSRFMKTELSLDPPERRTGLAAHDFMMAIGQPRVVMTRSARAGDAPALASRWLQRLGTAIGEDRFRAMKERGSRFLHWSRALDETLPSPSAKPPCPMPPLPARPRHFSVTEIETLRRDPYAVYARRVLRLSKLDPLLRDPGAAERGSLFHEVLHAFARECPDPLDRGADELLLRIGRAVFEEEELPEDVMAVWWPRFERMVPEILSWERGRAAEVLSRHPEIRARAIPVDGTGATLSARADRIDLLDGGRADILDFKTGSTPTAKQARSLLVPQLALEGALLMRGAFTDVGPAAPRDLAHVRLKAGGEVKPETILKDGSNRIAAGELAEEAWQRLGHLIRHFEVETNGYASRTIPMRERETDGDYDHLARVLEWSAGGDAGADGQDGGDGE